MKHRRRHENVFISNRRHRRGGWLLLVVIRDFNHCYWPNNVLLLTLAAFGIVSVPINVGRGFCRGFDPTGCCAGVGCCGSTIAGIDGVLKAIIQPSFLRNKDRIRVWRSLGDP